MFYLLSKMAFLLLMAGLFGFLFGRWWIRRQFIDVTEEHRRALQRGRSITNDNRPELDAISDQLLLLTQRLDQLPAHSDLRVASSNGAGVELGSVSKQLGAIEAVVKSLQKQTSNYFSGFDGRVDRVERVLGQLKAPANTVDLSPMQERLSLLEASVRAIHIPPPPPPTDLSSVHERLSSIEASIDGIPTPDLSAVIRRIGDLEGLIKAIRIPEPLDLKPLQRQFGTLTDSVNAIQIPEPVDIKPLQKQIVAVAEAVHAIRIPEAIDIKPLQKQIAKVDSAVKDIAIPAPPDPVDLNPIKEKLSAIQSTVTAIRVPPEPDLGPIHTKLKKVELAVMGTPMPDIPPPPDLSPLTRALERIEKSLMTLPLPDLTPIQRKLDAIDTKPISQALSNLDDHVRAIRVPQVADLGPVRKDLAELRSALATGKVSAHSLNPDLGPMYERLERIERTLQESPAREAVDLSPLEKNMNEWMGRVASSVEAIRIPTPDLAFLQQRLEGIAESVATMAAHPTAVDDGRLNAIATRLERMEDLLSSKRSKKPAPEPVDENDRPLLLEAAEFGPQDDLKKISGVGPVLERLLNRLGVWYFWQMARWNDREVKYVDYHLEAFKGRILRDNWVAQAERLAETSERRPPTEGQGELLGLAPPPR